MDSCAEPCPSHLPRFPSVGGSLQVVASPCWENGPSRRYLRTSFLGCLAPYPGCPDGACTRFFPPGIGLLHFLSGSALGTLSCKTTSRRRLFSRLQAFRDVQASEFARHPDRSDRRISLLPRAAMAFTSTHISGCYLPEPWICSPSESSN
jgi:hypothetical protein